MKHLFLLTHILLITGYSWSQGILYNQGGISLSYTTSTMKSFFCPKENKTVHFVKVRWTLSNNSGKTARIYYGLTLPPKIIAWCTPGGVYDAVTSTNYQPSGTGFGGGVILKTGSQTFGEDAGWYFITDIVPGWGISEIDFAQKTTPTNTTAPTKTTTPKTNAPSGPIYGIYQNDNVNNPAPSVKYAQKQKQQDKATDNAMQAWKNSYQNGQNQISAINNMSRNHPTGNTGQQQVFERQQQLKQQQVQANFDRLIQQQAAQQQRYEQTQIQLDNAKNVSMSAYQEAINNGRRESGAMLDATLAGAQQITDSKASLAYTGVGLGISLFMHLAENKSDRLEADANRRNELYRKKLMVDAKNDFLNTLTNISQYSFSDLIEKDRYAALMIVPNTITASPQEIGFTIPILIKPFSDSTYPSKESIQSVLIRDVSGHDKMDKRFFILYPIIHLQQFSDDFTKKIASGNVIGFDAKLIAYTGVVHELNSNDTTDFWGNPVKKDTINIKQKPSVKKTSDFWNQ